MARNSIKFMKPKSSDFSSKEQGYNTTKISPREPPAMNGPLDIEKVRSTTTLLDKFFGQQEKPQIVEQDEKEEDDDQVSASDRKNLSSDRVTSIEEEFQTDEKVFFEMIVKAVTHNLPKHVVEEFQTAYKNIDSEKMYQRMLEQKIEYHQFTEWVEHDIRM